MTNDETNMSSKDRAIERLADSYIYGLAAGLDDIRCGSWVDGLGGDCLWAEGYRDAIDDSDDYPEPFDPERTLVP